MEHYTRMLLHFVLCIAGGFDRVEAFLFATRLTRITKHLSGHGVDRAVTEIPRAVPDWGGGTRIGEILRTFNLQWARRMLGHGPVVLLISDGWDRGDPKVLGGEMGRLQRCCHRLIWLNPLLGSPRYAPLTRGMQAALAIHRRFSPCSQPGQPGSAGETSQRPLFNTTRPTATNIGGSGLISGFGIREGERNLGGN